MDIAGLPALREAIIGLHGATDAIWLESVPVTEKTPEGATVLTGEVQVFQLIGHPTATRAYAWSHATEGARRRFVVVLHVLPIDTARKAVLAALVAELRAARN